VRVFGIDPGSERTGYGCVETDGSRHRIVMCGAIGAPASASFSDKLFEIHRRLVELLAECRADSVAIENIFYAANVRSALKLGHARGVAMLAAAEAGNTRRPRSNARSSAMGVPRSSRCSTWSSCCSVSPPCRRRMMRPTLWRSRSATCTRYPGALLCGVRLQANQSG